MDNLLDLDKLDRQHRRTRRRAIIISILAISGLLVGVGMVLGTKPTTPHEAVLTASDVASNTPSSTTPSTQAATTPSTTNSTSSQLAQELATDKAELAQDEAEAAQTMAAANTYNSAASASTSDPSSSTPSSPTVTMPDVSTPPPVPTCTANPDLASLYNIYIGAYGQLTGFVSQAQQPGGVGSYGMSGSAEANYIQQQITTLRNAEELAYNNYIAAEHDMTCS